MVSMNKNMESNLVAELQGGRYWLERGKVLSKFHSIPGQFKGRKPEVYHSKLFS